jgi:hypothetical protein
MINEKDHTITILHQISIFFIIKLIRYTSWRIIIIFTKKVRNRFRNYIEITLKFKINFYWISLLNLTALIFRSFI